MPLSQRNLVIYQVIAIRDYKNDTRKDMTTGKVEPTGLPSSNVLYYELNDNAWCCVRPSGTEPKIKFYFGVKGVSLEDSQVSLMLCQLRFSDSLNKDYDENIHLPVVAGYGWFQEGKRLNASSVAGRRCD